jgi:hypothetical protein
MDGLGPLAQGELTLEMYQELRRMCRVVVRSRRLPANPYSPTGSWEQDAFDDLVDLWFARTAPKLATWANDPDWFWWQAERSLYRFILNQRLRTNGVVVRRNLLDALAEAPQFTKRGGSWGLTAWSGGREAFDGNEARLRSAAAVLDITGAVTAKGRLRSDWMCDAASRLLDSLGQWMPVEVLAGALLDRLEQSAHLTIVELAPEDREPPEEADPGVHVDTDVLARIVAEEVAVDLTPVQADILRVMTELGSVAGVAKQLGLSRAAVGRELEAVRRAVERHAPEGFDAQELLRYVQVVLDIEP